jgi:hypothetical protein
MRVLVRGVMGVMCALAGCLVLGVSGAPAAVTHKFLPEPSMKLSEGVPAQGPKGEAVAFPGPFETNHGIKSMTVDSGELYVADREDPSRIDKFSATSGGAFVAQFPQIASPRFLHQSVVVGHSTGEAQVYLGGDVYPGGQPHGEVGVLSPAGALKTVWTGADTPSKGFGCFECEAPGSIAVDGNPSSLGDWAAGDVYVVDLANSVVDVFKPLAGGGEEYVTQLTGPEPPGVLFSKPVYVAVSPLNGEVMVSECVTNCGRAGSTDTVYLFKPAAISGQYEFVGKLAAPASGGAFGYITGLTVDGGNGDIYVVVETHFVDEFNSEGRYAGQLTGAPVGTSGKLSPFAAVTSVAVDPASHDVYIGDLRHGSGEPTVIDVFGSNIVLPDVTTGAVTGVTVSGEGQIEAVLNGTVRLDKEGSASCQFVWGTTVAFGHVQPCSVGVSVEEQAVSASIKGLVPGTTYFYRLQATNKNGTNPGEESQDQQFTTPGSSALASVSDVASSSATLGATVDPRGVPTSYYFQYGKSSAYEAQVPAAPGAPLGSGEEPVEAPVRHLQGLEPSTLYHYRVVTVAELEVKGKLEQVSFAWPDQTFTTQSAGGALVLPDSRQWELVSPPNKHGALITPISEVESSVIQASALGGAITYVTNLPSEAHVQGYVYNGVQVMSTRGSGGWSSQDISLPHATSAFLSVGLGNEYKFFSPDLSLGMVQPLGEFTSLAPESSPPDTERTPYVRHDSTCASAPGTCFEPLVTGAPGYTDVPEGTKFGGTEFARVGVNFVDGTPDLAHVLVSSTVQLTSVSTGVNGQLYEWSAGRPASEELRLVSVLPNGEPGSSVAWLGQENGATRRAMSDDGSRVVWSESAERHLYMRDVVKGQTVELDAVQGGPVGGTASSVFQIASKDGSRVFFTDEQRLTADAGASPGQPDLYECRMVEVAGKLRCELSDLTPSSGGEAGAGVQGSVLGASEDGAWVYFEANGVLGDGGERGATPGNCSDYKALAGTCNLYVYHEGTTRLVAVVSGDDYPDWSGILGRLTARVSANGEWLAFMSDRSLTGYDNRDARSGHSDEEVYLYHAEPSGTGKLVCASCNPTGARPVGAEYEKLNDNLVGGSGVWASGQWIAANVPGWTAYRLGASLYQSRYLSDEGRLFFNSGDALVPQDINNNQDVYQYEPTGIGDCSSVSSTFGERSGGCVSLISSGTAVGESAFLDASANGNDVFFLTGERLAQADVDTALDVYDAHVCSSSAPCVAPAVSPPACTTADACRASPSLQPSIFGSPSSATFSGAGNISQPEAGARVKGRSLTRAQKLSRALGACRKKRGRGKRAVCERQAHRRYGARQSRKVNATKRGMR